MGRLAEKSKTSKPGKKPAKKITARYLHNAGLAYLQKFAASRRNFETVLMRKVARSCRDHPDQDIETCKKLVTDTADKFERAGLLNDKLYAEGLASSLRRGGKSKKAITLKMTHKGLDKSLAHETLEDFDETERGGSAESEMAAALTYARKKRLAGYAKPARKAGQKDFAAMARGGFSYDTARKILNAELEE